jgi:type II secretory pathway pseudopilin PulG
MQIRTTRRSSGFTLVEIMIVVASIALLVGMAMPNLQRNRDASQLATIQSNLREIDNAKDRWAMDARKGTGSEPSPDDLTPYFNHFPIRVVGEVYFINAVGDRTPATATLASPLAGYAAGASIQVD